MQTYQVSPYLCVVHDGVSGLAMAYHALYGNPRVMNEEGVAFLSLFKEPHCISEIAVRCDGDVEDIVENLASLSFIINPGTDEKRVLLKRRAEQILLLRDRQTVDRIGLAISDSCNFGCMHCIHFQPMSNAGNALPIYQRSSSRLNMSWKTARRCVDQYVALTREQRRSVCKIHFGNAEPLVNWAVLEQVLEYCSTMSDLSFEFAINTNLALMTMCIAEILKKHRVRIAASLDGGRMANDAIRITRGGRGTFDRILSKFDLLADIGYPLDGFSITVTNGNFGLIDTDVIDIAVARGMGSIAFDYDLVGLVHVPIEERVARLMYLKKYANEHGIDFFGTWDSPFRNLMSGSSLNGDHAFCAAVQGKSLEFNVDGSVKICSHATTPVGNIDEFDAIFHEDGILAQIVGSRFPGSDEACSGCEIEGPCGGQCHVTREASSRPANEAQKGLFAHMCDFYRAVTEALIRERLQSMV